jgi:DNA-binding transcriptional LysR family regulator
MDWNLLKVFHEISQSGGVTHAARKLSRKQPALSLALKRLETRLGMTLCRRGPAGFQLTEEGQRIADICAELSRNVEQIPDRLGDPHQPVRGSLRIRLISHLSIPLLDDALAAFHATNPQAELLIDTSTWDAVGRALLREDADIGVAPARLPDSELQYEFLGRELHRAYCGRSHPLFGKLLRHPSALAETSFVTLGADEPEPVVKYRLRHGIGRQSSAVCQDLDEAKRLVMLGVGVCFLPEALAEREIADGGLWPILAADEPAIDIFVITNPKAAPNPARQRFLEELRRRLPTAAEPPRTAGRHAAPTQRMRRARAR